MDFAASLTKVLGIVTLLGNIFTVLVLLTSVFAKPLFRRIMGILSRNALALGALLAAAATIGSWVYGEVTGYAACILCWIQRIFVYPQMFLFGMAWWRKDEHILPYTLMLSLFGGAVGLYQWVKDMLALYYPSLSLGCPVVPGVPSCDRIYVDLYGYITIPMISLNIFILIALVSYAALRKEKWENG